MITLDSIVADMLIHEQYNWLTIEMGTTLKAENCSRFSLSLPLHSEIAMQAMVIGDDTITPPVTAMLHDIFIQISF